MTYQQSRYRVFTRRWWRDAPGWPGGLAPNTNARKRTIGWASTEDEAREMCARYNTTHKPGRYGIRAEFMRA